MYVQMSWRPPFHTPVIDNLVVVATHPTILGKIIILAPPAAGMGLHQIWNCGRFNEGRLGLHTVKPSNRSEEMKSVLWTSTSLFLC
jgi:hypothetical protein